MANATNSEFGEGNVEQRIQ